MFTIVHSCATVGVIETLKALGRELLRANINYGSNFDKRFLTDTSTPINHEDLEMSDHEAQKHATIYLATPDRLVRHLISNLGIDYQRYDFVDIGCGKGRVLMVASNFPFRSISGIELSRPAYSIAMNNLRVYKCGAQKCFDIHIHNLDARDFEPRVANTVYYLFEPFDQLVLIAVLRKIASRLKGHGKVIFIICIWSDLGLVAPFIEKLGFQTIQHQKMLIATLNYTIFRFTNPSTIESSVKDTILDNPIRS